MSVTKNNRRRNVMPKTQPTRTDYERFLNDLGVPEEDRRSNGGRISDHAAYGTWTRREDPVAFNVGYNEFVRNYEFQKR